MEHSKAKAARRIILINLYEHYVSDPMKMLTPEDLLEIDGLDKALLAANSHYLHDRGFIELLIGYNPPLFAATRISPEGIDLIEDTRRFREMFSEEAPVLDALTAEGTLLVLKVADEAAASSLSDVRKAWLLDDLQHLRNELRKPAGERQEYVVGMLLGAVSEYFDGAPEEELPSLPALRELLTGNG